MQELEFYTLNVFSENGIRGGNQLAVIFNANNLNEEMMQVISKQFNYSESTFVTKMNENGADVRIFLPNREIPFAGHPTIGTAFIVEKLWRKSNKPRNKITLNLKLGPIDVSIQGNIDLCTMDQFPPIIHGICDKRSLVAELLSISENDILDIPIYLIAPSDLPFMFVPVRSTSVLNNIKPQFQALIDEFDNIGGEPYVFAIENGEVHSRLFAPKSGVNEDPATGSAQASLALALIKTGLIQSISQNIIVKQGYQMGRPSILHNEILIENGELKHTKTSGKVYLVSYGKLLIE